MIVISSASNYPTENATLVPSLQSHWLYIHVTTVSLSQGILGISFVVGLVYLIKAIDQSKRTKKNIWLEIILFSLICFIGFVIVTSTFNGMYYNATFEVTQEDHIVELNVHLTAIIGP